jgi:lipid-A-disaccharide synthase
LAKAARKRGIKVLYYISPQVWAWRKGRINRIRRDVDKMAVILPFEEEMYRKAQVDATFVGHPLLDVVKTRYGRREARERFGLRDGAPIVGLLPGSRRGEVGKLLPIMLETARIMKERRPELQFILPLAETVDRAFVSALIGAHGVEVKVIEGEIYDVVAAADMAIVASGTATLETALLETPMVIVYKVSPLEYSIGKRFIHVDHIGLVNIIAGKTVVPEFIQDDAAPAPLARALLETMADGKRLQTIREDLAKIKGKLGEPGASGRAAALACGLLQAP